MLVLIQSNEETSGIEVIYAFIIIAGKMSFQSSSSEIADDGLQQDLQPKEDIYEPLKYSSDPDIINLSSQISTLNENNRNLLDQRCNEVSKSLSKYIYIKFVYLTEPE